MLRIMLVDDQEQFRRITRNTLQSEGDFQVIAEGEGGTDAVRLMEELSPDLTIMDVQMPTMNGFEATRIILERHPDAKVALISMTGDAQYPGMAAEVGALGFIAKRDLTAETLRQLLIEA